MITPRQEALLAKVREILRENGEPAPTAIIARLAGIPKPAVDSLLESAAGPDLVEFGESGWGLRDWALAVFGGAQVTFGDRPFGPRDLRQELGVPRRAVMDLIDFWQREGLASRAEEGFVIKGGLPHEPEQP